MTIELYPVKIEAYDDGENLFKLESFDENTATLTVDGLVHPGNVDEMCEAIKTGVKMLRLEPMSQPTFLDTEEE